MKNRLKILLPVFCCLVFLFRIGGVSAEDWNGISLPEEAHYSITYFGVKAGFSTIRIEKVDYKGREAIKITAKVQSTKIFSVFYRVKDTMVSIIDAETLQPLEHKVDYEEGSYRRKTSYSFDYGSGKCLSDEGVVGVKEEILDPLGALLYLRIQDLQKGLVIKKEICDGRGVQEIEAKVAAQKKIATFWGWKQSHIIKPVLKDVKMEGVNELSEKVTLYFLNDVSRIPYLVSGKLKIGSLVARLRKLTNGDR